MNCNYLSYLCLFEILVCFAGRTVAIEAIIGGEKTVIEHFSYQALVTSANGDLVCGAGILSDEFILAAAHCVIKDNGEINRRHMYVVFGISDLEEINSSVVKVQVNKVFVTKEYDTTAEHTIGDISVLKLLHPLRPKYHQYLKVLELSINDKQEMYVGQTAEIAGFGWNWMRIINGTTEEGGHNDTQLRYAIADILSSDQDGCPKKPNQAKQICARVRQHHPSKTYGTCSGDSGGPLVHRGMVIGVLSTSPFGCDERDSASIYTRVTHYLDFIRYAMNDNNHHREDISLELV